MQACPSGLSFALRAMIQDIQLCQMWPKYARHGLVRTHMPLMNRTCEVCHVVWRFNRQLRSTGLTGVEGCCIVWYLDGDTILHHAVYFYKFQDSALLYKFQNSGFIQFSYSIYWTLMIYGSYQLSFIISILQVSVCSIVYQYAVQFLAYVSHHFSTFLLTPQRIDLLSLTH